MALRGYLLEFFLLTIPPPAISPMDVGRSGCEAGAEGVRLLEKSDNKGWRIDVWSNRSGCGPAAGMMSGVVGG